MTAFYSEWDPYAAQWLRNLIEAGHIAPGVVDERSIAEIDPDELNGYTQCHFFAGIGVWSYALRLAGWPDDRPVWTGSCPCQPFSAAGKGEGHEDERHLWPVWQRLISEREPAIVFGEQVGGADGLAWLDVVLSELENDHYAVAAADLPAAGVGAPHIRQRLFFVAHATGERRIGKRVLLWPEEGRRQQSNILEAAGSSETSLVAHADGRLSAEARDGGEQGLQRGGEHGLLTPGSGVGFRGNTSAVAESGRERWDRREGAAPGRFANGADARWLEGHDGPVGVDKAGFWSACDWLPCRDGKARPVESGTFPLVDGSAFRVGSGGALEGKSRVGMLRAYGNAIVAPAAGMFIRAAMEATDAANV
jgi:DNA (cytosine-5)-methyltransferase 1